ncbi:PREDICTED: probable G-protein coupled receptor 160 [Elephantulus edwardii]|uniref:probable G-protein coupled receptor 160 n=1 Tax=Elephantulus edwardii TaxID=28737 RepID=UPI0003F0DA97|nr:PREDICTED: probable G-protein coupled receptor 160 [Elephantulus edwardii]
MTVFPSGNCSSPYKLQHTSQPLGADTLLFLILSGKTLLNVLILGMRRKKTREHFMGHFCLSLALLDLFLLISVAIISLFRDFVLLGIRFTRYHICLLTQIISFTYGFLHYPVCLIACIDYYLTFSKTTKLPFRSQRCLYLLTIIVMWTSVLAYVLGDPAVSSSRGAQSASPQQCPFYVSSQGAWLACSVLLVLGMAFIASWSDVVAMIRAVRVTSYRNEVVLYLPRPPHSTCTTSSRKALLPQVLVCFLGTWSPFVLLQISILLFRVQIPAYIEMNIPWLYFVNSFLIAACYWLNCHKLTLNDITAPVDPFVSWKCCFIPLTIHNLEKTEKPMSIIIC